MSIKQRLEQLEQECRNRGVKLIYDDLRGEGGLCRLRDCYYVVVNRRLASETVARIIADALTRVPERVDMPEPAVEPAVRDMTDKGHDRNPLGISDRVPVGAEPAAQPSPTQPAPIVAEYPEPEFEEPTVGVPVSAGVPDNQS
jgi:hypothetical protein